MNILLRYLAILFAAFLVFYAANYLDNAPMDYVEDVQIVHTETSETEATDAALPQTQVTEAERTETTAPAETEPAETAVPAETEHQEQRILLTFAGDCTFGGHTTNASAGYGFLKFVGESYDYPFRNVKSWIESDDLTMMNLECALTDKGGPQGAKYSFRGPKSNVNFLSQNSIEMVTMANNHAYDYGQTGYDSTRSALEEHDVAYVEKNSGTLVELESGITVGVYATVYNSMDKEAMVAGIAALKEQGADLVIYAPHWGTENSYRTTARQKDHGRAAIDAGADIVYGCHPHVLQPIEEYNDGVIYYSLGNFSFGGNIYPADYDTALIQQEVIIAADGTVTLGERTIVPCSVSSMENRNNFQPTPYEVDSKEYNRVLSKLDGTFRGANLPVH